MQCGEVDALEKLVAFEELNEGDNAETADLWFLLSLKQPKHDRVEQDYSLFEIGLSGKQ